MHIAPLLRTICTDLTARFPGVASCTPCFGPPAPAALPPQGGNGPHLWIGLTKAGTAQGVETGEWDLPLVIEAVVAGASTPDSDLLNLIEGLLTLIPGATWGLSQAHPAEDAMAQGCPTHTLASQGRDVWVLSWSQTLRLGKPSWASTGCHPSHLFMGQAPRIGQPHEGDYTTPEATP